MIAINATKTTGIGFKYERLGDFCYFCGKLGHTDRDCLEQAKEDNEIALVFQYGPFLVASPHQQSCASLTDREKEKSWVENLANRKQVQRVSYNNPNAIRLGPPSAARKLQFSPPKPDALVPKALEAMLCVVAAEGSIKLVLRARYVDRLSKENDTEEGQTDVLGSENRGDKEGIGEIMHHSQAREVSIRTGKKAWRRADISSRKEGVVDFMDTSESVIVPSLSRKRGISSLK
uniref:CCHC-type domain-containing protein n=1 Tax=Chenopodium quinoa TaxID=63459 RepID=A0A803NAH3_CHEQI